eukprot:3226270-Alexandrium_andersonii.AAC.1
MWQGRGGQEAEDTHRVERLQSDPTSGQRGSVDLTCLGPWSASWASTGRSMPSMCDMVWGRNGCAVRVR